MGSKKEQDQPKPANIYTLGQIPESELNSVGGKAASLDRLIRLGILVPPGYVLTTNLYQDFLTQGYIATKSEADILNQFDEMGLEKVAVRSSSLVDGTEEGEDSDKHSWPGIFETILNVRRGNLINAVKSCWESARSERARQYAEGIGVDTSKILMAVVVQEMVDGEVSGVSMSQHPFCEEIMYVEAVDGLCEALVDGKITPDKYILTKDGKEIITKKPSNQDKKMVAVSEGVRFAKNKNPNHQKMTDANIIGLSQTVALLENKYSKPVDVEWTMRKNRLYVTQCRPMTGLEPKIYKDLEWAMQRMVEPFDKWTERVKRAFSLFRASVVTHAHSLTTVRELGLKLDNILTYEYIEDEVKHCWDVEQYKRVKPLLAKMPEELSDLTKYFLDNAERIIKTADSIKNTKKKMDLERLVAVSDELVMWITVIPLAFLDFSPKGSYPDLEKFSEMVRAQKIQHASFTDAVLMPACKSRLKECGIDPEASELLTVQEILDGNFGSLSYRLKAVQEGKHFVYQSLEGRETVIWLSDISRYTNQRIDINYNERILRGDTGYPGKYTGSASVFPKYANPKIEFNDGNVLVSVNGHTDLKDLILRSGAQVCNDGGTNSHGAIYAREFHIPSVIGVTEATRIIKQGDVLEVDADEGLVKIISRQSDHTQNI